MTIVGFHASHEQLPPGPAPPCGAARRGGRLRRRDVLGPLRAVERAPGRVRIRVELARRRARRPRRLPFGVVTAPGQRYHPAITAQAIATLEAMFPGRFWAALGSGEAINEHVTGDAWPAEGRAGRAPARDASTSSVDCSRARRSAHDGLVHVDRARIWSLPAGAAAAHRRRRLAPRRPRECAEWADGLDHGRPVARRPARRGRRLPRRGRPRSHAPCRCTSAGRRPTTRPRADRARPVAHAASCPARWPGSSTRPRRSTRRPPDATADERAPRPC